MTVSLRADGAARLHDTLAAARFTEHEAALALGLSPPLRISAAQLPWLSRRLDRQGALPALIRLFLLGESLTHADLSAALPPGATAELLEVGILGEAGGRLGSDIRVTPVGDLLLAHDPEGTVGFDHVPGVGPASRTLAGLTLRDPVSLALDMGTGCGIQALLASRHARHVIATDISERALAFGRFNAALNGIENVEFRQGNLFEPVRGEVFDLIVANPPFVVSPDNAYTFRDSGLGRDAVSRAVVSSAASHLREGGFATVLFSWIHRKGDADGMVRAWLDGSGCDAWVLHHDSEEPLEYAVKWNEWARRRDEAEFAVAVERWLDYFEREEIEQIASGAMIVQKRPGENWFRRDRMPAAPRDSASSHVHRVFAAQGRVRELADDRLLLEESFALVDGHRLEQSMVYRDNEFTVEHVHMHLDEGVGLAAEIQPLAMHVLLRLDGERSLDELIREVTDDLGLKASDLLDAVLASVRELYSLGFLISRTPSPARATLLTNPLAGQSSA